MGLFSAPAPQIIQQQPAVTAQDIKPNLDPQGLQKWLSGTSALLGSQTNSKKQQDSGFNLGQAIALGSGGGNKSIFGRQPAAGG